MPAGDAEEVATLVARARAGDGEAFSALVVRWKPRALRTAYHLVGSWSDADDVTQDAFLRAYRGLGGFDRRAEFGTWLTRIVINCALNHLRARRRAQARIAPGVEADGVASPREDPRARGESLEMITAVLAALAALTPALRVTLLLATLEDMSYKEIAQALEIPEGTVAWRVNHARKLLRVRLAGLAPTTAKGNVDEVLRRTKEALGAS